MAKNIQHEFFELTLNTQNNGISSSELIAYLTNTDKLINSLNYTLNTKYAIGFDSIEIDVLALEKGSFKIPIRIKKITNNATFSAIVGAVFGGLISHVFTANPDAHMIQTESDTIPIVNTELLQNKGTVNAVSNIAKLAIESNDINNINITYENSNGDIEQIAIDKQTLSQVVCDTLEEDSISNLVQNVTLEIVSPVFVNKPAAWKVTYDNKTFTAKMTDKDFLEIMNIQKLSFAKGDAIIADMEVVAKTTERGIRLSHYIRKVHTYPKYSRITRSEPTLFDRPKDETNN